MQAIKQLLKSSPSTIEAIELECIQKDEALYRQLLGPCTPTQRIDAYRKRISNAKRAVAAYEREQREIQKRTDLDATELHNYIHGHCAQEKYKWMDIQTDSEHKLHEEKGNGGMEFNESSAIDYQDNNALVPYDGSGEQYQQQVNYPQQQDHTQLHYEPQSQSWQMNGHECGEIYNSYGQRVGNYSNTYSSRENYQGY